MMAEMVSAVPKYQSSSTLVVPRSDITTKKMVMIAKVETTRSLVATTSTTHATGKQMPKPAYTDWARAQATGVLGQGHGAWCMGERIAHARYWRPASEGGHGRRAHLHERLLGDHPSEGSAGVGDDGCGVA